MDYYFYRFFSKESTTEQATDNQHDWIDIYIKAGNEHTIYNYLLN